MRKKVKSVPKEEATDVMTEPKPKAKKKRRTGSPRIITSEVVLVDVGNLAAFAGNPRRGSVSLIMDSLKENGQYRPLVVRKSTMEVLAGNHTLLAAKKLGWKKVAVTYVDVDENEAKKIVLADNRTNDMATYDTTLLANILDSIPDPIGTGFDDSDVKAILASIEDDANSTLSDIRDIIRPDVESLVDVTTHDGDVILDEDPVDVQLEGESAGLVEDDGKDEGPTSPFEDDNVDHRVGVFSLPKPEEVSYERSNTFHIPPLVKSMLMKPDELPPNLLAWAGSATKDWPDEDQWWLYNVNIDSTSGMKDTSKMITSFYAYDEYFINWWNDPQLHVGRALNTGVKYSVMPDFSQWADDIRITSMQNLYMNYWLARYMQDAGLKIIPNLSWRFCDEWYFDNVVKTAYPKGAPLVSVQIQTFDKNMTQDERDMTGKFLRESVDHIGPEMIMVYANNQGQDFARKYLAGSDVDIFPVRTRLDALSAQAKKRSKKKKVAL